MRIVVVGATGNVGTSVLRALTADVVKSLLVPLFKPRTDFARAREELGWRPTRSASAALLELFAGVRDGAGLDTPPLEPGSAGPSRLREFASGVGARLG